MTTLSRFWGSSSDTGTREQVARQLRSGMCLLRRADVGGCESALEGARSDQVRKTR